MAWKTAYGKVEASPLIGQRETLIKGMLDKKTLLDLIRHFIVFEKSKSDWSLFSPGKGGIKGCTFKDHENITIF